MYCLKFRKSRSKYFKEAFNFAKRFGAELRGEEVVLELDNVIHIYPMIRPLFGFIQDWEGTRATWQGKPVHPYKFILSAYKVTECANTPRETDHCGNAWKCRLLTRIQYNKELKIFNGQKYWFDFGSWKGNKYVIDKKAILASLMKEAEEKAVTHCPLFKSASIERRVAELPDYLTSSGGYYTTYEERGDLLIPQGIAYKKSPLDCRPQKKPAHLQALD